MERIEQYNLLADINKELVHLLYKIKDGNQLLNIPKVPMEDLIWQYDQIMGNNTAMIAFAKSIGFNIPPSIDPNIFMYSALETFLHGSFASDNVCDLPYDLFPPSTISYLMSVTKNIST